MQIAATVLTLTYSEVQKLLRILKATQTHQKFADRLIALIEHEPDSE